MKVLSSLTIAAAFLLSAATASHLDVCPGNDKQFDFYSANFESSLIDPRGQICLLVRGELKAEIGLQGPTVEFTAEQPGVLKKTWTAPVYGTLKNSDGTDLPIRGIGERELKVCFYLPPEFGNTKSGVELQISAKLKGKDKDGDDMRFLCTRGAARTI